jgi:hypothetical protein
VGGIALPALYSAQGDILKNATTQDHRVAIGVSIGIGVVAIAAALLALRGIWMLVLGVVDIGRGRTIDGRVLRVRRRNEKTYVAVDDGTDDHIAGWISTKSFQQGADVHARVATHNGYVREITVTGAAPPAPDGDITATTPASALAELFSGPAASNATPLELDPAWVASIVGGDVKPGAGSLLRGPHGLAVGGVSLAAGATAAFATISKLPPGMSTPVAGVGDEAARITPISGLAARAGDRGVLVFVRGGGLDESRRYDTAAQIATRCLGDGAAQARAPAPAPAPDAS